MVKSWFDIEIAEAIHRGIKRMAFFSAYIDESGTHQESKTVVVAAAVGRDSSWEALSDSWQAILRKHRVGTFHASEFYNSRGEFDGWTDDMRGAMIDKMVNAINSETSWFLGAGVSHDTFKKVKREFTYPRLKPYQFLLDACVGHLITWLGKRKRIPAMRIFIESGQDYNSPGIEWLISKLKHRRMQERYKMSKPIIASKEDYIPFQVADFMAYELYRFGDSAQGGELKDARQRDALVKIAARKRIEGRILDESDVREWFQHYDLLTKKGIIKR